MDTNTSQSYTFHVTGMHCKACILMTESELLDVSGVTGATSSLQTHTVRVEGDFGNKNASEIAEDLTKVLSKNGYALFVDKPEKKKNWGEFAYAIPMTAAFVIVFLALQKAGLVNLVNASRVSYGTAFVIGIIASLSTCMAMVGGLLLSMSATFAKEGDRVKPQLMFHAGRIASFFILGGVIGMAGSMFQMSGTATLVLGLMVGLVMLILGINLLDVFDWTKKLQPAMPKFIASRAHAVSKFNHTFTPLLVGIATFFLPCGFTQSMQFYSLTTGSFTKGAFTMLAFALGTFPVLSLISFSSFSVEKSKHKGIFFKTAGLIVILFGLFNLTGSLVAAGFIPPLFTF